MISAVTTAVSTIASAGMDRSLELVAILILLALLLQKEIVVGRAGVQARAQGKVLNICPGCSPGAPPAPLPPPRSRRCCRRIHRPRR